MNVDDAERSALIELALLPDVGAAALRSLAERRHAGDPAAVSALTEMGRRAGRRGRSPSGAVEPVRVSVSTAEGSASGLRGVDGEAVAVTVVGDPEHPSETPSDPHVPPVLFWIGGRGLRDAPRVGIVGTRRASRYGLDIARSLGRDLSSAGVGVVSGLALGVDGAAHRGSLEGSCPDPVAVMGCGVDVIYPRRHRGLWEEVRDAGVIVSEYPPGVPPAPWRFPARNRILAACCDALVVVESGETGGSLITAGIAAERGVPVLAVPGSVHSSRSVGCNRLLADGAAPFLDLRDVLDVIGVDSRPSSGAAASGDVVPPVVDPSSVERAVWDALGEEVLSIDAILDVVGAGFRRSPAQVLGAVSALEARGLVWADEAGVRRRHDQKRDV